MKRRTIVTVAALFFLTGCSKATRLIPRKQVVLEYGTEYDKTIGDYLVLDKMADDFKDDVLLKGDVTVQGFNPEHIVLGEFPVEIMYGDQQVTSKLVVKDTTAPAFENVEDITIRFNDVNYDFSQHIHVTDKQKVTYTIDTSKIDFDKPGEYTMTVTASDLSGNEARQPYHVTVSESAAMVVSTDDEELDVLCDEILTEIILPEMDDVAKAEAVYDWVNTNIRYSGTTALEDWRDGAKKVLQSRRGDCAAYCYSLEALLTRLGFENVEVHAYNDYHLWNMVKIADRWYHLDATQGWSGRRFLLTTKEMEDYVDDRNPSLVYQWDESQYPVSE